MALFERSKRSQLLRLLPSFTSVNKLDLDFAHREWKQLTIDAVIKNNVELLVLLSQLKELLKRYKKAKEYLQKCDVCNVVIKGKSGYCRIHHPRRIQMRTYFQPKRISRIGVYESFIKTQTQMNKELLILLQLCKVQ